MGFKVGGEGKQKVPKLFGGMGLLGGDGNSALALITTSKFCSMMDPAKQIKTNCGANVGGGTGSVSVKATTIGQRIGISCPLVRMISRIVLFEVSALEDVTRSCATTKSSLRVRVFWFVFVVGLIFSTRAYLSGGAGRRARRTYG